jgi:hydrogenase expression/formation protein HypC
MCLAVPGEIISIDESMPGFRMAKVSMNGAILDACIEWLDEEAFPGDYVLVHAGLALSKVDKQAADETLELFREMNERLEKEESTSR